MVFAAPVLAAAQAVQEYTSHVKNSVDEVQRLKNKINALDPAICPGQTSRLTCTRSVLGATKITNSTQIPLFMVAATGAGLKDREEQIYDPVTAQLMTLDNILYAGERADTAEFFLSTMKPKSDVDGAVIVKLKSDDESLLRQTRDRLSVTVARQLKEIETKLKKNGGPGDRQWQLKQVDDLKARQLRFASKVWVYPSVVRDEAVNQPGKKPEFKEPAPPYVRSLCDRDVQKRCKARDLPGCAQVVGKIVDHCTNKIKVLKTAGGSKIELPCCVTDEWSKMTGVSQISQTCKEAIEIAEGPSLPRPQCP